MPRAINRLKQIELKTLPVGLHNDGAGLHLSVLQRKHIDKNGNEKIYTCRSWIYRYSVTSKQPDGSSKQVQRKIGLGSYNRISLKQARALASEYNFKRIQHIDPATQRQSERQAERIANAKAMTFEEAALARIKTKAIEWKDSGKSAKQWKQSLEDYVFPVIGKLDVQNIDSSLVHKVLEPIWTTKTETARRVQQRMVDIFRYCIGKGYRSAPNPAVWEANLDTMLSNPKKFQKVRNHPCVPHNRMHEFIAKVAELDDMASKCLMFIAWTACRSSEARQARWHEFDLDEGLWTIPHERMKAKKTHIVPLQPELVKMLKKMYRIPGTDLVFPNNSGTNPVSDVRMKDVLKACGFPDATIHGFRASFKSWSLDHERNQQATEFQLAHNLPDATEASYVRTVMVDARRVLMRDWLRYTMKDPSTPGATVTDIRSQRLA